MTLCKIILYILLCTSIICGIICFLINIYCKKKESFVPNKKVVIKSPSAAAPQNSNITLNTKLWENTDNKNYPEIANPNNNFLLRSPNINNTSISMSGNIEGLKGYYSALKDMFYQDAEEYVSSKGLASIFYTIYSFGKISAPDKDYLQYKFPDLENNIKITETSWTWEKFLNPQLILTSNKLSDYGLEQKYPICINSIHSSNFRARNTQIANTYYQPIYNPFYISTKTIKTDISEDVRERPYEITPLYTGIGYNLKSTKYSIYQTPLTVTNYMDNNIPMDHNIYMYGVNVASSESQTQFIRFFKNSTNVTYQVTIYYNALIPNTPAKIDLNLDYIQNIILPVESKIYLNMKDTLYTMKKFFIISDDYITILHFVLTNVKIFSFIVQEHTADHTNNNKPIILTSQSPIIKPYSLLSHKKKNDECFITYPWETNSLEVYPSFEKIRPAQLHSNSIRYNYFKYNFKVNNNSSLYLKIVNVTPPSTIKIETFYGFNVFVGNNLKIITGPGIGVERKIVSNNGQFIVLETTPSSLSPLNINQINSWFKIYTNNTGNVSFSKDNNTDYIYRSNINPMKIENDFYIGSYLKETASFNGQLNVPFIYPNYNDLNIIQQKSLSDIIQGEIQYKFWTQNIGEYRFDSILKNFKPEYNSNDIIIRNQKLIDVYDNDPLNLISLFRRGVKKIVCFIPTNLKVNTNDEYNFCEVFVPLFKFYIVNLIFKTNKLESYSYTNCKIEDCDEDCKLQLIYLYKLIVKSYYHSTINYGNISLTILKNESFGILETYQVNILFVSQTITVNLFSLNVLNFIGEKFGLQTIKEQYNLIPYICKKNLLHIKNDIDTIFMNKNIISQPDLHFDGKDYNTITIYEYANKIIDKTSYTKPIPLPPGNSIMYNLSKYGGFFIDNTTNTQLHYDIKQSLFYSNNLFFVFYILEEELSVLPINIISINSGLSSYLKCFINQQKKLCVECNVIISYNVIGAPNYKRSIIEIPFYFKQFNVVSISYQNNILKLKSYTKKSKSSPLTLYKEIPLYSVCSKGDIITKLHYNNNTYVIGEIIQYNKVLKDDEILSIEKYLIYKWDVNIMCIYGPIFYFTSGNNFTEDMSGNNNIYPLDVSKIELKISNNVLEGNLPYEIKNFSLVMTFTFEKTGTDIRLLNFNNISVLISGGNKFIIQKGSSTILESTNDISFNNSLNILYLSVSQDSIDFTFLDLSSYRKIYLQKSGNYEEKTILSPIIGGEPSFLQNPTKSEIIVNSIILYDKYLDDEDINKIMFTNRFPLNYFIYFQKYSNHSDSKVKLNLSECDKDTINFSLKITTSFVNFDKNSIECNTEDFTFIFVLKINKLNEGSNIFKIFDVNDPRDYLVVKNSIGIYKDTIRFQNGNTGENIYMCNLPKIQDVKNMFIARIKGTELYFEQITSVNKVPKIVKTTSLNKIKKQSLRKIQIGDDNIDIDLFQIIAYERALYDFEINTIRNSIQTSDFYN